MLRFAAARRDLFVAALAQALQYGSGLILLPVVVRELSASEAGLWYVFIAAQGLSAVADFGFQPTIARYVSMAWSGAANFNSTVRGDTRATPVTNPKPNLMLLASLLATARRLYAILAGTLFIVLLAAGYLYVAPLARASGIDATRSLLSWSIFSMSIALGLYFLWIPAFLLGLGRVSQNYTYLVMARGGPALLGIIALLAGGGLVALSCAFLIGQIIARVGGTLFLSSIPRNNMPRGRHQASRALLRDIAPNAVRLGLVGVGAFLITRLNVFAISSFYGLPAAASFSISLQMLMAVNTIAQLPAQASLSQIVNAQLSHDQTNLRRLAKRAVMGFFAISLIGSSLVVLLASDILLALRSNVSPLATTSMVLLAVILILEGNHSLHAFLITTANKVPFALPALVSGAFVAIFVISSCWMNLGITGVIAAQGAVQLAYNNWRWPLMFWKEQMR